MPDIALEVRPEENTNYRGAMIVYFLPLEQIPEHLHDKITRERKGRRPEQRVRDIAAKMIGRVPANICLVIYNGLNDGRIESIRGYVLTYFLNLFMQQTPLIVVQSFHHALTRLSQ